MKILVLGAAADVRGFALAGVDGRVVSDAGSARREIDRVASAGEEIGLLMVSASLAQALQPDLARLRAAGPPPAILVLPETGP